MQVYAIFDVTHPDSVRCRLKQQFNADHYDCGTNSFFVATNNQTTQQVAEAVGLGTQNRGVITLVTVFWGYHDSALWEWIRVKHQTNGQ